MSPAHPALGDVEAAASRLADLVCRTPFVRSPWLSTLLRAEVWLKLESLQPTGSFKVRGAVNAIARLKDAHSTLPLIVTASAGNHGAAVAFAAARAKARVRVYLPVTAPSVKREALARLGAETIETASYDEAEARAREDASRPGAVYLSAYNDPDVIAGAGTVALEMLNERPDLDTFVVPLGGGGLLSGVAIVARDRTRGAIVLGAEAAASPAFTAALAAGRPVTVDVRPTLADGLAGNMEPDTQTFGIVRDLVDRVLVVREQEIEAAIGGLLSAEHLVAEGAGATAVGALLGRSLDVGGRRVGVIVTGRNRGSEVF